MSNTYDVRVLARLHKERVVQVVQNRWYEGNGWDKAVVGYCREHGIMYQCVYLFCSSPPSIQSFLDIVTDRFGH